MVQVGTQSRVVDGSTDVTFGPRQPDDTQNWNATVPGRCWFPIFRFYSPTEAYFDKTRKLEDVAAVRAWARRWKFQNQATGLER